MDALLCGLLIFFYLFPFIAHSLATTCRLRRVGAPLSCVLQVYCHYWGVYWVCDLLSFIIFLQPTDENNGNKKISVMQHYGDRMACKREQFCMRKRAYYCNLFPVRCDLFKLHRSRSRAIISRLIPGVKFRVGHLKSLLCKPVRCCSNPQTFLSGLRRTLRY